VTQGDTLDEVVHNLGEAVALHLEGEDSAEFGLVTKPSLFE
jgi:predicted RNase H-like HicB family nuclease